MSTAQQTIVALQALQIIEPFVSPAQLKVIGMMLRGEERQHFIDKINQIADTIRLMPKTYEQDGKGAEAMVHLHYFIAGCDWHITEKDRGDGSGDHRQLQAFGMANLGYGPALGYISIEELRQNGVELDLYWEPKTIGEITKRGNY